MRINEMLQMCIKEDRKEDIEKVQKAFNKIRHKDDLQIISYTGDFPFDDFAVAVKDTEIYIVYSYDGGYGFPRVTISELLNCLVGV